METISDLVTLKQFFTYPNDLCIWRKNKLTTIKLIIEAKAISIEVMDNIVHNIYGMQVDTNEETLCKLSYLILSFFPHHFEYDFTNCNYKLL